MKFPNLKETAAIVGLNLLGTMYAIDGDVANNIFQDRQNEQAVEKTSSSSQTNQNKNMNPKSTYVLNKGFCIEDDDVPLEALLNSTLYVLKENESLTDIARLHGLRTDLQINTFINYLMEINPILRTESRDYLMGDGQGNVVSGKDGLPDDLSGIHGVMIPNDYMMNNANKAIYNKRFQEPNDATKENHFKRKTDLR